MGKFARLIALIFIAACVSGCHFTLVKFEEGAIQVDPWADTGNLLDNTDE